MPQLDGLGLRDNPFKNNTDQRYFYADKNRAQIIESTEHLIEFSGNLQVIIGESGVGKSHLLEAVANRIDNNWRVAKFNHADTYDTLSLIQAILDAFGVKQTDPSEPLEVLETQLAEIAQLGFKPVLLIDNAHTLSIDSLRFLIQLSQQKQNEDPYINIVLFANEDITEPLQSAELKDFRDIVHIATLERFDKEGLSGYLRHKMAVVGYDRELPFTTRIIDSIYNNSEGLPEKINFFADKFLASSGKADNYIELPAESQKKTIDGFDFEPGVHAEISNSLEPGSDYETDLNKQIDEFITPQNDEHLSQEYNDNDLQDDRSDRAAEQISRLAEKFEEIEQLGEQEVDTLFVNDSSKERDDVDDEGVDDELVEHDHLSETPTTQYDDSSSGLPKFIIPVAVVGLLIVAVIVINSVFDEQRQETTQQAGKEKIELLPLELPPQNSVEKNTPKSLPKDNGSSLAETEAAIPHEMVLETATDNSPANSTADTVEAAEKEISQEIVGELEVIQTTGSAPPGEEQTREEPVIEEISAVSAASPAELTGIEPEPVIGSRSAQYITVTGAHLEKEVTLVVHWDNNKKEFSAKQTPEQWQYINKNKIKLHLTTGIEARQWLVSAKSSSGVPSAEVKFDVIRPFIAKMSIKTLSPNPFTGSDKRQTLTIRGQGFSKQTTIELKWAKNKKQFSSRLTPSQFEFISSDEIRLFIATGIKERKWHVLAIGPQGNTSASSFNIVQPANSIAVIANSKQTIKNKIWIKQQADTNYTIQLFGSHSKQATDELIKKYSLKGDIIRFETQRDGKSWFTLTYGNYQSKQLANEAVAALAPALTSPTPWIRSMGSIKEVLQTEGLGSLSLEKAPEKNSSPLSLSSGKTHSGPKDEAWIWTQNPADYTVQLIALSSETGIKDYVTRYKLQSESVYFKAIRDGKALFILLYGRYSDKNQAVQAGEKLAIQAKDSKPWVRSFSAIHGMMNGR